MLSVVVARFGTGLTLPYTLIFLHEVRGIPLSTVGALLAVPGVVGLVAVAVGGALVDRSGPRAVLRVSLLLQAGGCLVVAFGTHALAVLPGMVLIGAGLGPSLPSGAALLSGAVEGPEQARRAFGINFTAFNAAMGMGSLIASGVVDVHRSTTFTVLFVCQAAAAVVASMLLPAGSRPVRERDEADSPSYREALADPLLRKVCVVSLALSIAGYASVDGGLPAYARVEGHVAPGVIGLVFVVNTATIVSLQLLALRLLKGKRRTTALSATGVLWALSWLLLGLVPLGSDTARLALLLTYGGLFGVGEILMAPSMQPLVNVIATDRLRGRYNALSGLMFSLSLVVAPAVSSVLIANGLGRVWIVGMVGCGLVAALVAVRLRTALTDEQDGLAASAGAVGAQVVLAQTP